ADELGINRETVARHLRQGDPQSRSANAPTGPTPVNGAPSGTQVERSKHRIAQVASHGDIREVEAELPASAHHPTGQLSPITASAAGSMPGKLGPEQLGILKALKKMGESNLRVARTLGVTEGAVRYRLRREVAQAEDRRWNKPR